MEPRGVAQGAQQPPGALPDARTLQRPYPLRARTLQRKLHPRAAPLRARPRSAEHPFLAGPVEHGRHSGRVRGLRVRRRRPHVVLQGRGPPPQPAVHGLRRRRGPPPPRRRDGQRLELGPRLAGRLVRERRAARTDDPLHGVRRVDLRLRGALQRAFQAQKHRRGPHRTPLPRPARVARCAYPRRSPRPIRPALGLGERHGLFDTEKTRTAR